MNDRELKLVSGWAAVVGILLGLALLVLLIAIAVQTESPKLLWVIVPLFLAWDFSLLGFVINAPNQVKVVTLLGKYVGTLRDVGFFYGIPLYWRKKVSLRIRTFETGMSSTAEVRDAAGRVVQSASEHRQPLKVQDQDGTPIDISA